MSTYIHFTDSFDDVETTAKPVAVYDWLHSVCDGTRLCQKDQL